MVSAWITSGPLWMHSVPPHSFPVNALLLSPRARMQNLDRLMPFNASAMSGDSAGPASTSDSLAMRGCSMPQGLLAWMEGNTRQGKREGGGKAMGGRMEERGTGRLSR